MTNKTATVSIKNVSCIKDMTFSFELKPGYICLVGSNGSGKTTLLNIISRFIQYSLRYFFYGNDIENAEIKYSYNGTEVQWTARGKRWYKDNDDIKNIIKKGIYESGIVYGNRFFISNKETIKEYNNFYHDFDEKNTIDVSGFIIENMGAILKNNKEYYSGLKTIKQVTRDDFVNNSNIENFLIRKELPILMRKKNGYITQYEMSSGEFMLLRLLGFIDLKMSGKESETRLVIIDEVEIALHPSAQKRLFYFFNNIAKEKNIFVIFSTHSQAIINICKPENIYLLENKNGNVFFKNPCFPKYAIRNTYEINGYDFLILVEDELAKKIVLNVVHKNNLANNKLIHVMTAGGWSQIIPAVEDINLNKVFPSSKIILVLDQDIKKLFYKKYMSPCITCNALNNDESVPYEDRKTKLKDLIAFNDDIIFLPVLSLEKEVHRRLIDSIDYDFIELIDDSFFFKTQSLIECVEKYKIATKDYEEKNPDKKYDRDGKKIWCDILKSINPHQSPDNFISYICDALMKTSKNDNSWDVFEESLKDKLSFLRNQ